MSSITVIDRVSGTAQQLPLGSKLGLAVIVLGFAADLLVHLDPALDHNHGAATGPELSAHLVVFAGMSLVLAGVLVDGVRSGRRSGGSARNRR